MKKRKQRIYRVIALMLSVCLAFGGFSAGQILVSAAEVTGYKNEAVVRFKNAGSGKYLNVHYGQNSNGVNVYQWEDDGSTEQRFRLRYNLEEDCYMIGAMCSSDGDGRVLDIVKSNGQVVAGCNVQIYSAVDPIAQQWQLAYHSDGKFVIFPVANVYTVLTAYGDSNGSSNGRSTTSAGNVFLSEIEQHSVVFYTDYQLWYIEEVGEDGADEPEPTVSEGACRIVNSNGKRITVGEDMVFIRQELNPRNVSSLTESERVDIQRRQLWRLVYLHSGYYLIELAYDTSQKLCAIGEYETLNAMVYLTTANGTNNTWHKRLQWKIIPNASGGYRIVSKGASNSTAMTALVGSNENDSDVGMVPYTNAASQQWTFERNSCYGCTAVGDHMLAYYSSSNSPYYRCLACNREFDTPQEQDFALANTMPEEVLTVIVALEHMAVLKQMEGNKEHFVQACYRAADLLRIQYGGVGLYDCKDSNGHYVSPVQYDYDSDTINASVEFELTVYADEYSAERDIIWKLGQMIPFPFNCITDSIWYGVDPTDDFTLPEMLAVSLINLAEWAPEAIMPKGMRKLIDAISFINNFNVLCSGSQEIHQDFMGVTIEVYDENYVDRFVGYYDVTTSKYVVVFNEEYHVTERTVPLDSARENWLDGVFVADNGGTTEFYTELFPINN